MDGTDPLTRIRTEDELIHEILGSSEMVPNDIDEINEHQRQIEEAILSKDMASIDGSGEIHRPLPIVGPQIYLWEFPPDTCPTFITIASNEDVARQAIIAHPEIGELMAVPDYLGLITGPPTRVVDPQVGAAWVMNWKTEDRVEAT